MNRGILQEATRNQQDAFRLFRAELHQYEVAEAQFRKPQAKEQVAVNECKILPASVLEELSV